MKIKYTLKKVIDLELEEYKKYCLDNPNYPHTFEFWKVWDRPQINVPSGFRQSCSYLIFDVSPSGCTSLIKI